MATIKSFEDLSCWQLAREVARDIGQHCRRGQLRDDPSLMDQIRRSSGSVMDNLAEGFDRGSRGEFIQFLGYAKGSAGEVKSQLYRAFDNEYLTQKEFESLTKRITRTSAQIKGLLTYLNSSSLKGERYQKTEEPEANYSPPELPDFI